MSTAITLNKQPKAHRYLSVNHRISALPKLGISLPTIEHGYLESSDFYQLKGGFIAEVIKDPGKQFIKKGILDQVTSELGMVLLKAFEKTDKDAETYLSGNKFTKVAIWVDYLIVIRRRGIPIAFCAATFVNPFILYMNSLMIIPECQPAGLGVFASMLLWDYALKDAKKTGYTSPDIVCRTQNRTVTSALLTVFNDGKISTEMPLTPYDCMILTRVADFLHCQINLNTGVSYEAYPDALPEGVNKNTERITTAFSKMGKRDACYVFGKINEKYIQVVLKRCVRLITEEMYQQVPQQEMLLPVAV